jgi:hypothetical protein
VNNLEKHYYALRMGLKYKVPNYQPEIKVSSEAVPASLEPQIAKTLKNLLGKEELLQKAFKLQSPSIVLRDNNFPRFTFQHVRYSPDTKEIHVWPLDDSSSLEKQLTHAVAHAAWHGIKDHIDNGHTELLKQIPKISPTEPLESNEKKKGVVEKIRKKYIALKNIQNLLKGVQDAVFTEDHPRLGKKLKSQSKLHGRGEAVPVVNTIIVNHLKALLNKPGKYLPSDAHWKRLLAETRTPNTSKAVYNLYKALRKYL